MTILLCLLTFAAGYLVGSRITAIRCYLLICAFEEKLKRVLAEKA